VGAATALTFYFEPKNPFFISFQKQCILYPTNEKAAQIKMRPLKIDATSILKKA